MIRLDLSWFYRMAMTMGQLKQVKYDVPVNQSFYAFSAVRPWLHQLTTDPTISPSLRSSRGALRALTDRVDTLWSLPPESNFSFSDYLALQGEINQFETILNSELAVLDSYFVLEKKPYSTVTLITEGQSLFPPATLFKVPEAKNDLEQAGKCLAFEVPTAAAFHIHRATEAVLRKYWTAVAGNTPKPKLRTIGVYLAAMKKLNCGDSKVIAALSQMNELHRNPTIHPEDYLDLADAIALIGIANSVVAAMLKEIPDYVPEQPNLPGLGGIIAALALPDGTDDGRDGGE
jgi:hypothetical protein